MPTTSPEKVRDYLREAAASVAEGDPIAASAVTFLPFIEQRIPQDPALLDDALLKYAAILLHLRSDGAVAVTLAFPGGDGTGLEDLAAELEAGDGEPDR